MFIIYRSPQNADHADCRLQTVQTMQTVQTVQTEYFFYYSCFCIYFWLAYVLVLVTLISVQLYIGVFFYAQAALTRYVTVDVLQTLQGKLSLVQIMLTQAKLF